MIQNLKLYVTLTGSGSYALTAKLWTHSNSYHASVPIFGPTSEKIRKIKSSFSGIRSNFTGLNEEDWLTFDTLLKQLNTKSNSLDPAMMLSLSLASARASTGNELWKLTGPTNKFPYIVGIAAEGNAWKEFLLIPYRENSITDAYNALHEAWLALGHELKKMGVLRGRSSTGAWLGDVGDTELLYLVQQIARDWNMGIGMNIGADRLYDGKSYDYGRNKSAIIKKSVSPEEQMSLVSAVAEHYKIEYIEDPFHSSDFMSHSKLSYRFEDSIVAGCDLYGSDPGRIKKSHKYRPTNTININPRHLRTVSDLSEIAQFARHRSIKLGVSMTRNETGDDWLSDLALAFGAGVIKLGVTGAASTSKYSRLMEIWEEAQDPKIVKIL